MGSKKEKLRINSFFLFGLCSLIGAVILVISIIGVIGVQIERNKIKITELAKYSEEFTTSRTGVKGTVVDVCTNSSKTEGMILLKFDNMKDLSTDAQNYRVMVSPTKNETFVSHPVGNICVYGSTGFMSIYIKSPEEFKQQLLEFTVVTNKDISTAKVDETTGDILNDDNYDYFSMYVNLGGSLATTLDSFEDDTYTKPSDVYEQLVIRGEEEKLDTKLIEMVAEFDVLVRREEEYITRLKNAGITVKDRNMYIKDLKVEDNMITDKLWYDGTLIFDWKNKNIKDGFIEDLKNDFNKNSLDYKQSDNSKFLKNMMNLYNDKLIEGKKAEEYAPVIGSENYWYYTDGTLFSTEGDIDGSLTLIQTDISELTSVWSNMEQIKDSYAKTLFDILTLECNKMVQDANFTINNMENALTVLNS